MNLTKREKIRLSSNLKEINILFVEDEENIRASFEKMIKRRVKNIYIASNGEEGVELFEKYNPEIVITDIQMPKMNGIEMIDRIRKIDRDVKIIIVSAFNDSDYLFKAIENEVSGYLVKPINKQKLYKIMNDAAKMILFEREKNRVFDIIDQVINLQENMVVVFGEDRVKLANREFLNFFGVDSYGEFNKKIEFCSEFIKDEGCFTLHNYISLGDCIEQMEFDNGKNITLKLKDKRDNQEKIFLVKLTVLKGISSHTHVMTFTNITDISLKSKYYERKATYDELTQIYNRAKFNERLDIEMERCKTQNLPMSVVMFDVDKFKVVNDTHGHLGGDQVLKEIAAIIKSRVRSTDIFARWGGEEFIVLLPKIGLDRACKIADTLREAIANHVFNIAGKITCSFGVSQFRDGDDKESLINRADEASYMAKRAGRNRVMTTVPKS